MKKIFTLALCMVISSSLFAQKVDYDHDSKWFFGLNVGGTWNTTDVDDRLHAGWGFIFGRQFNYNYGKLASFDVRLRYLGGKWYGHDYDTTSLTGYSPAYMPAPLAGYQNSPGYTVNNFETEVHELGLELAIHANRLRERSGWDPYIFGGINLAWNQTNGDLVNFDSSLFSDGQYDYTQDITKSYVKGILDDDYETAMNQGSELESFNLDVVPSLGFGIGYQVGPRFSLGLEHKTSFALKDDWDGFEDPELRWKLFENDVYHYSGGYLRFHIRGGGNGNIEPPNNGGPGNGIVNNDCDEPRVLITRPSSTGTSVSQQMFAFKAKIERIAGRDNITLRVNGQQSTNFFYNVNNGELEASIILRDGSNTIQVEANNACGTEVKNITINYDTCKDPVVTYTSPSQNNLTVEDAQYVVRAKITENATSVVFKLNGVQSSNFYYNASNGSFESSVTLREGANTVQIIATNDCGNDTETITINYTDCVDPGIQFLIANGSTVNEARLNVRAKVTNVAGQNNVGFRLNGANKAFIYNASTKIVESLVILVPGANTVQITVTNDCGTETETITVNYTPCDEPVISMITPTSQSSTSATPSMVFKASVQNVTSANQLKLKVNGSYVTGGTFSAVTKIFQKTITLQEGTNTIQLIATTDCDTDTETITVGYNAPCIDPAVSIVSPIVQNSTTENQTISVTAAVLNVSSLSGIQFSVNGQPVSGGSFSNGTFTNNVTLQEGLNTIVVSGTNDCGTDTETITVTYETCDEPVINLVNPSSTSVQSDNPTIPIQVVFQNVNNAGGIVVNVNGSVQTGGSFISSSGLYRHTISLQTGVNVIVISATNSCGTVTETITISYNPCVAPTINVASPTSQSFVSPAASVAFVATIQNAINSGQVQLTLNGVAQAGGSFNPATGQYTHNVNLINGVNNIVLSVLNECGDDSETFAITYNPCDEPTISMISPTGNTMTAQSANLPISAIIQNATSNNIVLTVNGVVQGSGTYNQTTGLYNNSVKLQTGNNVVVITVTTDCGTVSHTVNVNYDPCSRPVVTMLSPIGNVTTANASYNVSAKVTNVTSTNQITLKVNGSTVGGGSYSTGTKIYSNSISLQDGANVIQITATNSCGSDAGTGVITKTVVIETPQPIETMIICVPSRVGPKTMEIPVSEWATYQAKGATMGACPDKVDDEEEIENEDGLGGLGNPQEEATMVICHHPPGNPTNTQELEIPISAWPAHLAHGDTKGPCPEVVEEEEEETMVICHHPPGNPTNTQQLEIPISAWAAHQAHGDTQGPCPEQEEEEEEIENEDGLGGLGNPQEQETMVICHHPPGNPDNTQELEIPISAWAAHQAHGDTEGPCPTEEQDDEEIQNENGLGGLGNPQTNEEQIVICHHPPGNPNNTQQIEIPLSAWGAHQAHGDVLGPCPNNSGGGNNGGGNGNTNSGGNDTNNTQDEEEIQNENGFGGLGTVGGSGSAGNEEEEEENNGGGNKTAEEEEKIKAAAIRAKAEQEAKAKAAAEKKAAAAAAQKKAAEEAKRKAAAAAKAKAEQEAKAKAAAEKKAAVAAAQKKADEEAKRKAAAAAKAKAEQEAKAKAAAEKKAAAAAAQKKADEEAKRKAAAAAKAKAEQEAKAKAAAEKKAAAAAAQKKAAEEAKRKAAAAAKAKAAEEAKKKAEEEKKKELEKTIEKGGGR